MKKKMLFIIITFLVLIASVSAYESPFFTIKVHGGYNFWLLGSLFDFEDSNTQTRGGGLSFDTQFLFMDPELVQFGASFGYQPMLIAKVQEGGHSEKLQIGIFPLTANAVINYGKVYTDIGLGIGFLHVSVKDTEVGPFEALAPKPSIILKVAQGLNFNVTEKIAIDLAADALFPFGSFGIFDSIKDDDTDDSSASLTSPFLSIIFLSQINLKLGVSISF